MSVNLITMSEVKAEPVRWLWYPYIPYSKGESNTADRRLADGYGYSPQTDGLARQTRQRSRRIPAVVRKATITQYDVSIRRLGRRGSTLLNLSNCRC